MNVQQIITRPITTPEYPDPEEVRRFIYGEYGFYGYDYVFLVLKYPILADRRTAKDDRHRAEGHRGHRLTGTVRSPRWSLWSEQCGQLTLNVAGLTLNFKKNLSLSL